MALIFRIYDQLQSECCTRCIDASADDVDFDAIYRSHDEFLM